MPTYILLIIALLVLWFIRFALGNIINRIISSKIAVVRRVPPTKVLRAHLLGLTLAFAFSLIAVA
ncbi:hypothetical protein GWO43_02955, partial [candidate division KSB1 bacterium]|nr:hypothetical protein [candidate division KSB1 bacterium]NIS23008.1 hypothetical protein [candidate division KSB1 bacterium]NIT69866.1 hypothetical protein [candidate division KSB1 bacterium]NIU23515.1 hypothetical protein [candidate division KSB1 bacterium]NIW17359.1 hypothetical protein [candidate division KSB1 bacterium]